MLKENKKFDYLVFIGRFQIFHNSHLVIIKKALQISEKLIIVIGSAFRPRDPKNPFTMPERREMILLALTEEERPRVSFTHARDYYYNDIQWAQEVSTHVNAYIFEYGMKIGIIGHKSEDTNYFNLFPQWEHIETGSIYDVHATELRETYFNQGIMHLHDDDIPLSTKSYLNHFFHTSGYLNIKDWFDFVKNYKKKYSVLPYPAQHVTADVVVFQSDNVALVKRKKEPGKGLWALPGGFVKENEFWVDAAIRELMEETSIKLSKETLKSLIRDKNEFDYPTRSLRGRTFTMAYMIVLKPGPLMKLKGQDDAAQAKWISFQQVEKMSDVLFEDHFDIINYFKGRV